MPAPNHYAPWSESMRNLSQSVIKPSGHILLDLHDGRGFVEAGDSVQCVHCAKHWVAVRGSGHIRGWCTRCGGKTCGDPACDPCVPWERKLELTEAAAKGRILLPGQW